MALEAPRVFISYSHDSPAHKQWVALLATKLREKGIDAILDQWDLSLGDDVTRFMEEGVTSAQRVLVVCTDEYVRKADGGKGGVGYERLIVTAELVQNLGTNKFIPLIRHAGGDQKTPKFLGTRLFVDFSNDEEFDIKFEELLRELHQTPQTEKPAIGKNPYASNEPVEVASSASAAAVVLPPTAVDPAEVYRTAVELARRNDMIGWRQLVKKVRAPVNTFLLEWLRKHQDVQTIGDDFNLAVDEAVIGISPLLALALAGVESGRQGFVDQRALFDDLYEVDGWMRSGLTAIVELPQALCYVYQALHGAVCMFTGQIGLAFDLADMKVLDKDTSDSTYTSLWTHSKIIGWPSSFNGNYITAWTFITGAIDRWPWLLDVFGSAQDYRMALASYYMALNVYELVDDITKGKADSYENARGSDFILLVPLAFTLEEPKTQRKALMLLVRDPKTVATLWERQGVKREAVEKVWPHWIKVCSHHLAYHNRQVVFYNATSLGHSNLFQLLDARGSTAQE